jgi:hypothetical protein
VYQGTVYKHVLHHNNWLLDTCLHKELDLAGLERWRWRLSTIDNFYGPHYSVKDNFFPGKEAENGAFSVVRMERRQGKTFDIVELEEAILFMRTKGFSFSEIFVLWFGW